MDIWKKIIWSGNNRCHVSQEDLCELWVALYSIFTDAYSKIRFPEEENKYINLIIRFSQLKKLMCRVLDQIAF